jgi:hypothetical protein
MLFSDAMKARAVAMMPWELVPWHVAKSDSGGFDFGTDDPSFGPVSDAIAYQHKLTVWMSFPLRASPLEFRVYRPPSAHVRCHRIPAQADGENSITLRFYPFQALGIDPSFSPNSHAITYHHRLMLRKFNPLGYFWGIPRVMPTALGPSCTPLHTSTVRW